MSGISPSHTVSHPRRLEFSAGDKSFRIAFLNISDERPKVKLFSVGSLLTRHCEVIQHMTFSIKILRNLSNLTVVTRNTVFSYGTPYNLVVHLHECACVTLSPHLLPLLFVVLINIYKILYCC